jgi:hypothetical protein
LKIPFQKLNTQDLVIQKMSDNLSNIFNQLNQCPFLDGNQVEVSFTQNQDQVIAHGLNRAYVGFVPMNPNNFGIIKVSDTPNNQQSQKIILQATGSMVVSLWIF